MEELSGKGTIVLPLLVEDCEIPSLLKDRLYADFRRDYGRGLQSLLRVLKQESISADTVIAGYIQQQPIDSCVAELSKLSFADLRRRMKARMTRTEVGIIWYDIFTKKMEDDMPVQNVNECIIELYDRSMRQRRLPELFSHLCKERPDLASP